MMRLLKILVLIIGLFLLGALPAFASEHSITVISSSREPLSHNEACAYLHSTANALAEGNPDNVLYYVAAKSTSAFIESFRTVVYEGITEPDTIGLNVSNDANPNTMFGAKVSDDTIIYTMMVPQGVDPEEYIYRQLTEGGTHSSPIFPDGVQFRMAGTEFGLDGIDSFSRLTCGDGQQTT